MTDQKEEENQYNEKYRFELLHSFHTQFAENQNHHQNVLFKLLYFLGFVVFGFGYVLHGYGVCGDNKFDFDEVIVTLVVAEILIMIAFAVICNMARGFRRDQVVNSNIRRKYGVIAKKGEKPISDGKVFLPSFDPIKMLGDNNKIPWIDWMPEFHKIFMSAFVILGVLLVIAFFIKTKPDNLVCWALVAGIVLLAAWLWLIYRSKHKTEEILKQAKELRNNT